jgi:hypothetical protein
MPKTARDYPELAALLSGWFHQDFDIEGDTVGAIIRAFNASSTQEAQQALSEDIHRFLEIDDEQISEEFTRVFNPDIDPTGFAPTTRAFLEEVLLHLVNFKNK